MSKVLVAMSGGVDSSVTAYLLRQQGYDCIGVTMRLYDNETVGAANEQTCCSLDDVEDARAVCFRLGIPHHVFNFGDAFEKEVIRKFVSEYERGRTPNPCIECNRHLKFDSLMQRGRELGCDFVATGHYARILRDETGHCTLHTAPDAGKDQSYVLYSLTQEQLQHTLFPLGDMTKAEVRRIAEEQGFINANKKDSEDICFIPDGDYAAFLERYTGHTYAPGNFVDTAGKVLGQHKGIVRYTIGQRKGLGIAAEEPLYVSRIDTVSNTITLSRARELHFEGFRATGVNWPDGQPAAAPFTAMVAARYHAKPVPATIIPHGDEILVELQEPLRAVTPGQAVVVYDGTRVVCGGTIEG